jgi:hypothetical protein
MRNCDALNAFLRTDPWDVGATLPSTRFTLMRRWPRLTPTSKHVSLG